MRQMPHVLLVLTATVLLAADKKDEKAELDKANLQGTWELIGAEMGGQKSEEPLGAKLTFTGNKVIAKDKDGKVRQESTFKLDPTKNPKQMDVIVTRNEKTEVQEAIYSLDGDTLKVCGAEAGKPRPTKFKTKESGDAMLLVLKRVKSQDK
ncbi:MAG TPA: TIGR03067 domain-containing protein [Thermoguttaceae bacterium]|nr:TIGR03067 domain-containing protein [Thermoguttaceae bacterium]